MRDLQIISIVISSISILISLAILVPLLGDLLSEWVGDLTGPKIRYTVTTLPDGTKVFNGDVPQEVLATARTGDLHFW